MFDRGGGGLLSNAIFIFISVRVYSWEFIGDQSSFYGICMRWDASWLQRKGK